MLVSIFQEFVMTSFHIGLRIAKFVVIISRYNIGIARTIDNVFSIESGI